MNDRLIQLSDVLLSSDQFRDDYAVFLPPQKAWALDTICTVLNPDDVESDADEAPVFALEHGLVYALEMKDVQALAREAKKMRPDIDAEGLLKAFQYYHDYDAFIRFE